MNSIYKVIWSKAKNCYVVASEIAKSHTKSASGQSVRRSALASLLALSFLCGGLGVASATLEVVNQSGTPGAVAIYTKDEVDLALAAKGAATDVVTNRANIEANKTAINDLKEVDQALNQKIEDEKDARVEFDQALNQKIEDEKDARIEFDQALNEKIEANTTAIGGLTTKDSELEGKIQANKDAIDATNKRTDGIKYDDVRDETTIENNVTVDSIGNVIAKGQLTAYDGVYTKTGAITTEGEVNAGSLNVENASHLKGDVTMDNNLTVRGDTSLKGTKVDGKLTVTDDADLKNTKVDGTLTTTGKATFQEAVEMDKGLTVTSGDTTLKGTKVDGKLTVTDEADLKNTKVDGTLGVTGATTLSGELTAEKNATFEKDVTVKGTTNLKDTTVDGDLKVTGTITTDKMIFGDKATNNYTEIDHGKVTSKNLVVNGAGETISSSSTFNAKENKVGFANSATGEQSSHKQTSDMIVDNVKNNITGDQSFHKQTSDVIMDNVKDLHNSNNRTQTKTETKDIITDKDGNSSTTSQTASENKTYLKDKDGKNTNSTIDTAKGYDKTIKGENGQTSTKQDELDITNTAEQGTIKNDAKDIVNNATGNMTNTVGADLTTTVGGNELHEVTGTKTENVTGKVTENYKAGQETNVTGDQDIYVTGKQTNKIDGDQENTIGGNQTTNVTGDISNKAENITNEANTKLTDKVGEHTRVLDHDGITDTVTDTASGSTSTFKQRIDAIMGNVKTADCESEVTQKGDEITSVVGKGEATISRVTQKKGSLEAVVTDGTSFNHSRDIANASAKTLTGYGKMNQLLDDLNSSTKTITDGTHKTSKVQTALDITNTAADGTITNDAKNIVNNVTGDMTNTVGGKLTTTVTGQATENFKGGLKTDITGEEIHTVTGNQTNKVTGKQTNTVEGGQENIISGGQTNTITGGQINNITGDQTTNVTGDISNTAKNITNAATETLTDKVGDNTRVITSRSITDTVGAANRMIEDGKITDNAGDFTVTTDKENGTTFTNAGSTASSFTTVNGTNTGSAQGWTNVKGNEISTGKVEANYVKMDYADVMNDLGVKGTTTTKTLKVTENATVGGTLDVTKKATFHDDVDITKNLSVGGNATITGDVTANSYKVDGKTYIDANGINANDQKITNVADGSISEGSKDAVNGGQLYGVKRDLEHQVDKVGANAAAMANLRPMEFDPSSKWNIAAAIGNYGSETAAAIGAFYRPNDNVMVNLSTAFGTGENMVGGGVSVRLGKGGNKLSREETNALKAQVADLTARMDALLSVLNPNMSKDFPDVPENHWAYEAVSRLAGNDIVQGYPDGEFHGERTMTRYEMAEIIYNALSRGAEAERELVEEFKPELQAMAASEKATAEKAEG